MGIPTAVHESNAVPGLTTKQLSGIVDKIMVGFEQSRAEYKSPDKVEVTGTPVRVEFSPDADRTEAKKKLGLPTDKPLVLSVWGSLGATKMNEIIVGFIERAMRKPSFSFIHSAGTRGYDSMMEKLRAEGAGDCGDYGFDVRSYIYNMPDVMAAADLIICRSGASTLSELGYMGKPAVLIPSPNVTNNHQEKNARVLEAKGAARVLLESDCNADTLIGLISELLKEPDTLTQMAENMRSFGVPDATEKIADIVIGLAESKKK
jgi:UDP-N-acetylglucosamine--N-acetylmuramyl-(pentapeptide) pyrophosphoryl-undecaprenol N-acetylglucosamine transferase